MRLFESGETVRMCRLSSFMLGAGLTLILGLPFASSPAVAAADARPVIGDWEGTLDPGAQPKKRVVVHISAAQDGTLNGTIDYPSEKKFRGTVTAHKPTK